MLGQQHSLTLSMRLDAPPSSVCMNSRKALNPGKDWLCPLCSLLHASKFNSSSRWSVHLDSLR